MSHLTPGYTPEERLQRIERMLEFLIHRVHGIEWELESCGSVARDVLARDRGFRNSMDAWTGKTPEHKTYNRGQERAAQLRHQRWLYDLYAAGLPMIGRIYRTGEGE